MASHLDVGQSSKRAGSSLDSGPNSLINTASRPSSPLAICPGSATAIAWKKAKEDLEKSLPERDFWRITSLTGPEDILKELETWQTKRAKSKHGRVADQVRDGLARMQSFSRALDLLAQGTPSPGCLVWGSVVFVLTMVQNTTEEYYRICKALTRIIEYLPGVEIYTEAFSDSDLIQGCVGDFYCSLLRFWTKACKSYHRRRLWKFQRAWSGYETNFGELEEDMVRYQERLEKLANAKHIHESRQAIAEQRLMNGVMLKAQDLEHQRDIMAWLAPEIYEANYYIDDLVAARTARHVATCKWLLSKDVFVHFNQRVLQEGSLFWIYAQPGAGKTVLAAFLVDHFSDSHNPHQAPVLYFFCKNTDAEKNNPSAIIRSLLYQLFQALGKRSMSSSMSKDLTSAMLESSQKRAINFDKMWQIFFRHIADLAPATILVDALDECEDPSTLIENFQSLANSCHVAVILTSRKEAVLYKLLHQSTSIEIMAEDVDADIRAFVEAKVAASSCLSHPSVRDLVISRLCEPHEGMFLWAYLMWKELKSCITLREVQEALQHLPSQLSDVFTTILRRLQESLDKSTSRLCSKALTWIVTAIRPLKIEELRQALIYHYRSEGHSLLCADGSFPYSDKDIELVCGSLVHIRNGTLQVVHLTVKEYIQSCSGTDSSALLIEVGNASSRLAIVCLSFLGFNCTQPITNFETSKIDIQQLCAKTPFIEYAVTFWMFHLVRCEGKDSLEVFKQFKRTFNSSSTFCWMEMYLALHPSNVPDLLLFLDEIGNLGSSLGEISLPLEDSSFSFMAGWCAAIKRVLKEYGSALVLQPFQIHHLNLASTFSTGMLAEMYDNFGNVNAREKSSRFEINQHLRKPSKEVPPYRRLQGDIGGFEKGVGLFLYDSRREVYIWSPDRLSDTCEFVLFVQSATHGKQLRPVKCHVDGEANDSKLLREPAHSMSKDGTVLLIILYTSEGEALTLVWQIEEYLDFSKGLHAPPWACLRFRFSSKHVRNFGRLWFHPMCLAFRVDGGFCTPAGLLDSAFKTVSPTWADILQPLLNPRIDVVFYSGNGEFLFIHKNSVSPPVIEKLTWPHLEEVATFRLWDMARAALRSSPNPTLANSDDSSYIDVIAVSPSGRYLALQCTVPPQPDYAVLLDTVSRKAVEMGWEPSGASSFHFSNDETEINIFVPPHWNPPVKLIKYAGLPDHGFLKSEREFSLPLTLSSPINRWYVSNDHRLAIVATPSGVIQRIKFSHKLELLDTPKTIDHEMAGFVVIGVFVSQDGDQFAHLHEKGKNLCLQVREVANVGSILRNLEFGVEKPSSVLPITMSPDLSILVIGQKIYKIGLLDDQITSEPVQISDIPVDDDCKVIVSSSNIFIACVPKKDFLKLPIPVTAFRVFRLDVEGTSLVPMRSLLPGVAEIMSVEFHSSLPRMAIVYILESELSAFKATSTLSKNDHQARNQVVTYSQVAIIDLNTANIRHVQILGDPTLQLVRSPWPRISMGHCEMLRFLRHGAIVHNIEGVSFLCRITNFDRTPSLCRYLPCSYSFSRHFLAYGGRLYSLQSASVDHSRLTLTMNQPGWPVQHNVHLSNWVIVSQIYKHDVSISLLLGKNDDERMRLLISPWGYGDRRFAEIKTIPLTWAEAQAELNRLWEKRYGNGDYEPPEESDPDNKVINDLEMSDDGEDSLDSYFEEVDDDLKD